MCRISRLAETLRSSAARLLYLLFPITDQPSVCLMCPQQKSALISAVEDMDDSTSLYQVSIYLRRAFCS